ncbi:hypothetical protein QL285_042733 [Trifolium repens]|nr:hypothetical protein QL285_042733 [Trifolium repens]
MNQFLRSILSGAGGFIGNEVAKNGYDSSKVDNQFVVSSPSTPSCNKTIHAKSNQTNLSNTSSPDMNFESPVSFVCNNTLGEASIGHNIAPPSIRDDLAKNRDGRPFYRFC